MALLPIDLQALFGQTAQVAREQAVQKEAPPAAQSLQGAQIVQKAETRDRAVNETQHQEEGPEKVKDRARRGADRKGRREPRGRKPPSARPPAPNVVSDPDLGRNIDVTG